jgi:hypothetical protein
MWILVVVAAVKELYAKVMGHDEKIQAQEGQIASVKAESDAKIKKLEVENAGLKARLDKIEKMVESK